MMKKTFLLLPFICFVIISCQSGDSLKMKQINDQSFKKIKGEVLVPAHDDQDFYDIQILDDIYAVLNYDDDNSIRVYDKKSNELKQEILPEKDNVLLKFVRREAREPHNRISVLNNRLRVIEKYESGDADKFNKEVKKLQTFYFNFGELPPLTECIFTERGIYGVLFWPVYDNTFYYFSPDSGVIFGEPYFNIDPSIPNQPLAYACHVAVNEQANRVVTVSHFTNTVHFYDLSANLQQVYLLGNETVHPTPAKTSRALDVENSTKCFISVKATPDCMYALYSGDKDVLSGGSKIVVFNWKGKHLRTLQLDHPLTAFDVDSTGRLLLGITRKEKGTEIVSYKL